MTKVSASILDANFLKLEAELRAVEQAGANSLHLDVMDGHFVPNLSFGVPLGYAVRKTVTVPIHSHLMVNEPEKMIPWFLPFSDSVIFHVEATDAAEDCIKAITAADRLAGVSLNPDTPLKALEPYLDKVHDVLVMSVFPGKGGQGFIPESLDRIKELRQMVSGLWRKPTISVDGGVKPANARSIAEAGADVLIAGSAIFRSSDYAAAIHALKTT